jgi:hypothetical protein
MTPAQTRLARQLFPAKKHRVKLVMKNISTDGVLEDAHFVYVHEDGTVEFSGPRTGSTDVPARKRKRVEAYRTFTLINQLSAAKNNPIEYILVWP